MLSDFKHFVRIFANRFSKFFSPAWKICNKYFTRQCSDGSAKVIDFGCCIPDLLLQIYKIDDAISISGHRVVKSNRAHALTSVFMFCSIFTSLHWCLSIRILIKFAVCITAGQTIGTSETGMVEKAINNLIIIFFRGIQCKKNNETGS